MGEPARKLIARGAAKQTTRLIVIEGGKSTAARVASKGILVTAGASLIAILIGITILFWPSPLGDGKLPRAQRRGPKSRPAPKPNPVPPIQPCPKSAPRRHRDKQTCDDPVLDALQAEKDLLTKAVPPLIPATPRSRNPKKLAKVPCSRLRRRLKAQEDLLKKREQIQRECFGGEPDPDHERAISELKKAIVNTKELVGTNCAPGHPMANL